jgi:putative cardiolipin synthase
MRSGFRLLPYGPNSFATRIELTKLATRSLDVQYYLLKGDNTGLALMGALRNAATRGVRVRVLVDDLYTAAPRDFGLVAISIASVRAFDSGQRTVRATACALACNCAQSAKTRRPALDL